MATKTAALAVEMIFDATKAEAGIDGFDAATRQLEAATSRIDTSIRSAATAADGVSSSTEKARRSVDDIAASTDNLDTKMAGATGALGALSSGFELVGLEGYAENLMKASMATDFFSGLGQSATLILESQAVQTARAKVQTIAHTVATKASAAGQRAMAAATTVATAAQRGLNLALRANPIGLVITAVAALVAIFIVAYKKSETFRNIVQGAMRGAQNAVGWVVDKVRGLFGWVGDLIGKVRNVPEVWQSMKEAGAKALDALISPIKKVIGWVQNLLDKIASIDIPNPFSGIGSIFGGGGGGGGIFGFASSSPSLAGTAGLMGASSLTGSSSLLGSSSSAGGAGGSGRAGVEIHLHGVIDSDSAAREIEKILGRRSRRVGR